MRFDSPFHWIYSFVSLWDDMRWATDRQEHHVLRWFVSVTFLVLAAAPFVFLNMGYTSWLLLPMMLLGIGGIAFQAQKMAHRIWNY